MSISISYFPILSNHFLSIENSPPAITGVLNQISLNSVKNGRETTIKYCCYTAVVIYYYLQGSYPFLNKKFKNFSRTFKDTFPIFQGRHSVQKKSLESMSFLVLPQHE